MQELTRYARAYYRRYYDLSQFARGGGWSLLLFALAPAAAVWFGVMLATVGRFGLSSLPLGLALLVFLVILAAALPVGDQVIRIARARKLERFARHGEKSWAAAKRRTLRRWLHHHGLTPEEAIARLRLGAEHAGRRGAVYADPEPSLLDFVYTPESRSRVLTLFVLACSMLLALSIANGQSIEAVFAFLAPLAERGWRTYLLAVAFFALLILAAQQFHHAFRSVAVWFQAAVLPRRYGTGALFRLLEHDLIELLLSERPGSRRTRRGPPQ